MIARLLAALFGDLDAQRMRAQERGPCHRLAHPVRREGARMRCGICGIAWTYDERLDGLAVARPRA